MPESHVDTSHFTGNSKRNSKPVQ